MNEFAKVLFEHVRSCGMELHYLRGTPGYQAVTKRRESLLETLTDGLAPAEQAELERYLEAEQEIGEREEEALFQCGLSAGWALGLLVGQNGPR